MNQRSPATAVKVFSHERVVRQFTLMTIVGGIVGMSASSLFVVWRARRFVGYDP